MIIKDRKSSYLTKFIYEVCYNNEKHECPHCKCKNIIKHGKYKGIQRYLCKNESCGRTFSTNTGSVWYNSKKTYLDWVAYMGMMLEGETLKNCAVKLKINIATAFYWRHKILKSLARIGKNKVLKELVYMRKLRMKESFKGEKYIEKSTRDKIWVILASDNSKNIINEPLCRNIWDSYNYKDKVHSKLAPSCKILVTNDNFLNLEAKRDKKGPIYPQKDEKSFLNNYYNQVKLFLKRFYGVATKYLKGYLYWVSLFFDKEKFKTIKFFKDSYIQFYNIITSNLGF